MELYQEKKLSDAEQVARAIIKEFPSNRIAWNTLWATLNKTERLQESLNAIKKLAQLSPQDAKVYYNMGVTYKKLGKFNKAVDCYKQAIAIRPRYAISYFSLGNVLQELRKLDEAEASYSKAIALKPDYVEAFSNLGNVLDKLGRLDEAVESYRKAVTLKPDFFKAFSNLGKTLVKVGKLKEAEESYIQAIKIKPDYAEVHRLLSTIKVFKDKDFQFLEMKDLYSNKNISEEQRCNINFGLAKAHDDLGDFEQAYKHLREGNALRKRLIKYNSNKDIEAIKQIKDNYVHIKKYSLSPQKKSKKVMPIFIIGMPRSGTTLVEQIISSHSKVTGAGELEFVELFGGNLVRGLTKIGTKSLIDFRKKYLEKLQNLSKGNTVVTDKMPQNFLFTGLLAAAFPEAKIVHVKRNPSAVCWANYKQYFASKNIGFCYDLDDVVNYYLLYESLMSSFKEDLGKRIYDLDYELLVIDQESETKNLMTYLDLTWEDKCLSPQDNLREVETASSIQVRKKVYKESSKQWKKYSPFLQNAFDRLD